MYHNMARMFTIDFDAKDSLGFTQFMKACINGHNEVVKSLIKRKH